MGKSFRKSSARSSIRAPKFLDKSNGFYGRLDEPEMTKGEDVTQEVPNAAVEDVEMFNEDDGETLLRRKPSCCSSRWRRSLRGRSKEEKNTEVMEVHGEVMEVHRVVIEVEIEEQTGAGEKEPALVHFPIREEADDQVLIRDKKRVREEEEEEEEEERKAEREQKEGMKALRRNSVKNYRKALDRAFRRGWESFISNLYSVTLTPVSPSSSSSSSPSSPVSKKKQHSAVLAEFH